MRELPDFAGTVIGVIWLGYPDGKTGAHFRRKPFSFAEVSSTGIGSPPDQTTGANHGPGSALEVIPRQQLRPSGSIAMILVRKPRSSLMGSWTPYARSRSETKTQFARNNNSCNA